MCDVREWVLGLPGGHALLPPLLPRVLLLLLAGWLASRVSEVALRSTTAFCLRCVYTALAQDPCVLCAWLLQASCE